MIPFNFFFLRLPACGLWRFQEPRTTVLYFCCSSDNLFCKIVLVRLFFPSTFILYSLFHRPDSESHLLRLKGLGAKGLKHSVSSQEEYTRAKRK